jgi:hypothetical protein
VRGGGGGRESISMASVCGAINALELVGEGLSESPSVKRSGARSAIGSTSIILPGDTSHRSSILLSLKKSRPL